MQQQENKPTQMAYESQQALRRDVESIVKNYMQSTAFSDRKVTDLPTDALQVTSRKYVNLNGTSANRPTSSTVGQFYFDTDDGAPRWWSGSTWVDASGNPA